MGVKIILERLFFSVVASLLIGCSVTGVNVASPPTPSATDQSSAAGLAVATISATRAATPTLPPGTSPASPTITIVLTPTPVSSPTPQPTRDTATATVTAVQPSGRLVFHSRRHDANGDGLIDVTDGTDLYLIDLTTRQTRRLTDGLQFDLSPRFAPDGRRLVFLRHPVGAAEAAQLFLLDIPDGTPEQLTASPGSKHCPRWSPQGQGVTYIVRDKATGDRVERLNLPSSELEILVAWPEVTLDCLAWSPDGSLLILSYRQNERYHLALLEMATGQRHDLSLGPERYDEPAFLPRDDGVYLSVVQSPGASSSSAIVVFQLNPAMFDAPPRRLFSLEDSGGRYTWGESGSWFFWVFPDVQAPSTADRLGGWDIYMVKTDFLDLVSLALTTPARRLPYQVYWWETGLTLLDNDFYDNSPHWAP